MQETSFIKYTTLMSSPSPGLIRGLIGNPSFEKLDSRSPIMVEDKFRGNDKKVNNRILEPIIKNH